MQIDDLKGAATDERGIPPEVHLPPTINDKKTKAVSVQAPVSVQDNIVRITNDGDPVGQLIALMNGQPVPTYVVQEDGSIQTVYETPTMAQRISIAKWLGDRVMPKVNVNISEKRDNDWEATLKNAAVRD